MVKRGRICYFDQEIHLKQVLSLFPPLHDFISGENTDRSNSLTDPTFYLGCDGEKAIDHDRQVINDYDLAFKRIKEITEEDDLVVIVEEFIQKEDKNFALFNYVNELSNDAELLQEQCDEIREDMKKFKEEDIRLEGERKVKLKELEVCVLTILSP
jgi:hypothetical protein